MNDKASIRKEIKTRINQLGGAVRSDYSDIIFNKLVNLPEYINSEKIFVYISFDNEVHTQDLIAYSLSNSKRVFVPNINGKIMNMVEIHKHTEFTMNDYGIVEPLCDMSCNYEGEIDMVIMPLIGYDRAKSRLGRGGGFYDKFLSGRDCIKVAIAFSMQEVDKQIVEPHDIPADIIINEKEIIR